MDSTDRRTGLSPGFTLIELLVVIVIIGILLTLVVTVGARVATSSKSGATRDVIRALDTVLDSYMADNDGDVPPAWVADPETDQSDPDRPIPIVDGVLTSSGDMQINSVGLFLLQARTSQSARDAIEALPSDFVRQYKPSPGSGGSGAIAVGDEHPELLTVVDAWGNPLRYVHPLFDGQVLNSDRADCEEGDGVRMYGTNAGNNGYFFGQQSEWYQNLAFQRVRRNFITTFERNPENCPNWEDLSPGDGDGGQCINGRPYFYSAGADADPSDREDNVYSTEPKFLPDRD